MDGVRWLKAVKLVRNSNLQQVRLCSLTVRGSTSGSDGFQHDYQVYHLRTTPIQRTMLGFGSAILSLADPRRGDMIACMGETTGNDALEFVKNKMSLSDEGRQILAEKPRITSSTANLSKLRLLPNGTVGKSYADFMDKYNYSPDERLAVRFVDDIELAYVLQRYREVHDLFHTILAMPTNMLGEVTVKWIEAVQTRIPMCIGGALFGATRLSPKCVRHYSTQRKFDVSWTDNNLEKTNPKKHPGVRRVTCCSIPDPIQESVAAILHDRNLTDIEKRGAALSNYLHSRKIPLDEDEVKEKRAKYFTDYMSKVPVKEDMDSEEIEYWREKGNESADFMMKRRVYNWKELPMTDTMCYEYLWARSPAEYAVICRVFNEIIASNPDFEPKSLFDFGSGLGTVTWAAHEFWAKSIQEYFTVDSSPIANDLALLILQRNNATNEPFAKKLYQRQFLPATPRPYDLVVSAYSLFELPNTQSRLETVANLWNKTDQYLVLIEQGTIAGFNILNEARNFIIHLSEKMGLDCHVTAPCPHELACPRLSIDKTPCNFFVKYSPYKHGTRERKSKTELFSYVILKKGNRDENDQQWPRIVRDVLCKRKHAICRMCTSQGSIEEVIFSPGKQGKAIYKCARHSIWGDQLPISLTDKDIT